ncbi:MAG: hypothetical protein IJE15_01760 [Bacteroidaceae bacterium]|nr:hypothetical protein [Bacteroidaceae bacterium]
MNMQQESPNDELTQRIAQRLGARQQKLQCMEEWERPTRKLSLPRTMAVVSAAACVALILMMAPWKGYSPVDELGIRPDLTEFRSGMPQMTEIQRLLDASEYGEALRLTGQVLLSSDGEIEGMKAGVNLQDEMAEYEYRVMREVNSELRWTYIYLLVQAGQNEEALQQLERYIGDAEYAHHGEEAAALREKLEKKVKK